LESASVEYGIHQIDEHTPVAFNRSHKAAQNNPEFKKNIFNKDNPVDRKMEVIIIKNSEKKILGCLNFFGVHTTSVSNRNTAIHHDNKGIAAQMWENHYAGAIALFAQKPAGDVSPNFIFEPTTKEMRGPHLDGIQNAVFNGQLQFEASIKINTEVSPVQIKSSLHVFRDFVARCTSPVHGLAFSLGTLDGRGLPDWIGTILKRYLKVYHFFLNLNPKNKNFLAEQGNKLIFLDHRKKKILGIPYKVFQYIPFAPSPAGEIGKQAKAGALKTNSWITSHLPIQIINLESIVLLCTPGEITTFAGNRLKHVMQKYYPHASLIVWSYCNAYMGYITTPEEYDIQCYEGGHTVYGRNTLNYLIECFELLAQEKLLSENPPRFSESEVLLRSYS
jgi:neutral ceramidase